MCGIKTCENRYLRGVLARVAGMGTLDGVVETRSGTPLWDCSAVRPGLFAWSASPRRLSGLDFPEFVGCLCEP